MHVIKKIFQDGPFSWKVQCVCGWKEGGETRLVVEERFLWHTKNPQTPDKRVL